MAQNETEWQQQHGALWSTLNFKLLQIYLSSLSLPFSDTFRPIHTAFSNFAYTALPPPNAIGF